MNERVQLLRAAIGNTVWQERYPIIKLLNATVIEVDEGKVVFNFVITKEQLNPNGILHGGIIATMLDELMGAAGWTINKPYKFATINLQVDYLSAAKEAEVLRGEGVVVKAGKTVIHAEAKLYNLQERVIAKASSNLVAMPTTH